MIDTEVCIKGKDGQPVCGRRKLAFEWLLEDLTHAVQTIDNGGRAQPCAQCLAMALAAAPRS